MSSTVEMSVDTSSGVDMSFAADVGGRAIAAAVTVGVAAALGAGWAAWQGGKLLVKFNKMANDEIAMKKRQLEAEERHRKMIAVSAHGQLANICSQILSQFESENIAGSNEIKQLKFDLASIRNEALPEDADAMEIERLTSLGYLKLNQIVHRYSQIAAMSKAKSETGLYQGLSVADLMNDIRLVIGAMPISATIGKNVVAADPDVLERKKLNEEFSQVTVKIEDALETVKALSEQYALTASANELLQSFFNGIDKRIEELCNPTISNNELKNGIDFLKKVLENYEIMAPSLKKEAPMVALYNVYLEASKALGEDVADFNDFESEAEIEEKLHYLKKRVVRAQECAEYYEALGPNAYICYALEQELKAMGYTVHAREKIVEMTGIEPVYAKVGENKIPSPSYKWKKGELTQLFSISDKCDLQVIVHDDGTVSVQTIAEEESEAVLKKQREHCSNLKELRENLRKNWFILYDYKETESPEVIKTVAEWMNSVENPWRPDEEIDVKPGGKEEEGANKIQYKK